MSLTRVTRISTRISTRIITRPFSIQSRRMADDKSSLDAGKGSVGSEFKPDGSIGGTAQKVGGPFDKDGAVGKQFKESGAIGGTAQDAADQMEGKKPSVFDKEGAVGKAFTAEGSIGSIGEAVGGPFAKDGAIGKNFNPDGAVGGTVQNSLGDEKK